MNKNKKDTQKYGLPAILSFFVPGLGQLLKGDGKGFLQYGIGGAACLFCLFIGFLSTNVILIGIGMVGCPLQQLVSAIDAYNKEVLE